jgi:hypothetical protein
MSQVKGLGVQNVKSEFEFWVRGLGCGIFSAGKCWRGLTGQAVKELILSQVGFGVLGFGCGSRGSSKEPYGAGDQASHSAAGRVWSFGFWVWLQGSLEGPSGTSSCRR